MYQFIYSYNFSRSKIQEIDLEYFELQKSESLPRISRILEVYAIWDFETYKRGQQWPPPQ